MNITQDISAYSEPPITVPIQVEAHENAPQILNEKKANAAVILVR